MSQNPAPNAMGEQRRTHAVENLLFLHPHAVGASYLGLSDNVYWGGRSDPWLSASFERDGTVDGFFELIADTMPYDIDREEFGASSMREKLLRGFEEGIDEQVFRYRRYDKERRARWTEMNIRIERGIGDDVEALVYSLDIDDQVVEKQIIASMMGERYDWLIVVVDYEGTLDFRNVGASVEASSEKTGILYSEWVEHELLPHMVDEDLDAARKMLSLDTVRSHLDKEGTYSCVFALRDDTGVVRYKLQRYSYLMKTRRAMLIVRVDTTEAHEKEQDAMRRLEEALDSAESANQAKSEFLSRMSHDIRTPINGIIGMLRIAQEQENPPETADCLAKIQQSSEFLLGLVNDILDLAKINNGVVKFHPVPYSQQELVDYINAIISPLCNDKKITLTVDIDDRPDIVPVVDKLRVNQVLFNLLSNAVKYTSPGGAIHFSIKKHLVSGGLRVAFVIADTGIGMSEEFQKVMFEPFEQADDLQVSGQEQGTGLGLSIVKQVVDLMGGTIAVDSAPGKGTTFTVDLQVAFIEKEQVDRARDSKAAAVSLSTRSLRGKHVLVCEDNEINREIIGHFLMRAGIQVQMAVDGAVGVQAFVASPVKGFDAVLMDIRMPNMDGLAATRAIRALNRPDAATVPIIALSANAYDEDRLRSRKAGMNAHLAKPVDAAETLKVLAWLCR